MIFHIHQKLEIKHKPHVATAVNPAYLSAKRTSLSLYTLEDFLRTPQKGPWFLLPLKTSFSSRITPEVSRSFSPLYRPTKERRLTADPALPS